MENRTAALGALRFFLGVFAVGALGGCYQNIKTFDGTGRLLAECKGVGFLVSPNCLGNLSATSGSVQSESNESMDLRKKKEIEQNKAMQQSK